MEISTQKMLMTIGAQKLEIDALRERNAWLEIENKRLTAQASGPTEAETDGTLPICRPARRVRNCKAPAAREGKT